MRNNVDSYHVPVLLAESVDGLAVRPDGIYVDATFGGGGHSRAILSRLGAGGHLFCLDQDADAEANFRKMTAEANSQGTSPKDQGAKATFVATNFRYLENWMRYYGIEHIDGLLADLGVSSHHFDDADRGFSFRDDAPLDMRMNRRGGETAAELLARWDERQLADTLYIYGELRQSRRLAAAITQRQRTEPITTTGQLAAVVERAIGPLRARKDMAQVFQALRITVNHELDALGVLLASAANLLATGGRLSVITYHSLEDRMVKNFIRTGNIAGRVEQDFYGNVNSPLKPVNSRVVTPSADETARNPRSRSAKLRVAEKVLAPKGQDNEQEE